jgi:hypothetical protein
MLISAKYTTFDDVLETLGYDRNLCSLIKRGETYHVVDESECFDRFKERTLGKRSAFMVRLPLNVDWSKFRPFLRDGIVFDDEFGWFAYPLKHSVVPTPLSLERLKEEYHCEVKGDPTLPSSYVFVDRYVSKLNYMEKFHELIASKESDPFVNAEIHKLCQLDQEGFLVIDSLAKLHSVETILRKKKQQKQAPKTKEDLLKLAAKTKQNTKDAIVALKDQLKHMAGKVVQGPLLVEDPGAELRKDPKEMARDELKRSRIDEEDSSDDSCFDTSD